MARSSTTFRRGNKAALKHGAYSVESVEHEYPAILEQVLAEIEANPIPGQRVDGSVLDLYAKMVARARLHFRWFEENGGPLTESGAYKAGWSGLMQTVDRIERFARLNGIGALARAQTAQLTANANLSQTEYLAAQARLRARQQANADLPSGRVAGLPAQGQTALPPQDRV